MTDTKPPFVKDGPFQYHNRAVVLRDNEIVMTKEELQKVTELRDERDNFKIRYYKVVAERTELESKLRRLIRERDGE